MIAILSDIHANLEALQAVLEDLRPSEPEEIICLGDVIGCGRHPRECLLLAEPFDLTLLGEYEEAVLFLPEGMDAKGRESVDWTRDQMNSPDHDAAENRRLWNLLGTMRRRETRNDLVFVHGSPRMPTRECIMPADAEDAEKMAGLFGLVRRACFLGHTHVPGVFIEKGAFQPALAVRNRFVIGAGKCIVNVGSVGQPRDGDPRACYVVFDGEAVIWRRVHYRGQGAG